MRPSWLRGQGIVVALALAGIVLASAVVVALTAIRSREQAEPRSETQLAACLTNHMVPDLTVDGETLIERACEETLKDKHAPQAQCIFSRSETMTDDDATLAVETKCGVSADDDL